MAGFDPKRQVDDGTARPEGARAVAARAVRVALVALHLAVPAVATVAIGAIAGPSAAVADDGGGGGEGGGHGGSGRGGGDDGGGDDGGRGGDDGGRGGDDRGKQGRGGDDDARQREGPNVVDRFLAVLRARGRVVWASNKGGVVEVRYEDGWSERVAGGRYALLDPKRAVVVDRAARPSDGERLMAAIGTSGRPASP